MRPLERLCGKISTQLKTARIGVGSTSPGLSSPIRSERKDGLAVYSTGPQGAHYTPCAPGGAR